MRRLNANWILPALVNLSLALGLWRYGALHGTLLALVLCVALTVFLPGVLLARALGKLTEPHPLLRFGWVLALGLGLTVCLGALSKLAGLQLNVYLLLLHAVMLILAFITPPSPDPDAPTWTFSRSALPLYALVILCCGVVLTVSAARNSHRLNFYDDVSIFAGMVNWLANDPDDVRVRSRMYGVVATGQGDPRFDTDGVTYNWALWSRLTGIDAPELVWYRVTPLFAWTVPLAAFALAYVVTRRETTAAYSAAVLTIVALLTVESIVYGHRLAFGANMMFQLNTVRTFSISLLLPLATMAGLAYLRRPSWRGWVAVTLAAWAVAFAHPRPLLIYGATMGATTLLWWLAEPTRPRLRQGAALLVVLLSLLVMPVQDYGLIPSGLFTRDASAADGVNAPQNDLASCGRGVRAGLCPHPRLLPISQEGETPPNDTPNSGDDEALFDFVALNLPGVGTVRVVAPHDFFFHPTMIVIVASGLLHVVFWRRSLTTQYIVGATGAIVLLAFVPGPLEVLIRGVGASLASRTLPMFVFGLPIGLVFGVPLAALTDRLPPLKHGVAAALGLGVVVLLLEPFPIPGSARDQIAAANALQNMRSMIPAEQMLNATLHEVIPSQGRTVLISPTRSANFVVEEIPHTFTAGGRDVSWNESRDEAYSILGEADPPFTWLDVRDVLALSNWSVNYVVLEADDIKLPSLLLQPERFVQVASTAGYTVFRVNHPLSATEADVNNMWMNYLYQQLFAPRWDDGEFVLARSADPTAWLPVVDRWQSLLNANPDDDTLRYGLAFALLMANDDAAALPHWQALYESHPDIAQFVLALAHTQAVLGDADGARATLLAGLDSSEASTQVITADALLTDTFFYLLDDAGVQRVVDVAEAHPVEWQQLANLNPSDNLREHVALLLSAGRYDVAERWLTQFAVPEIRPEDLVARAKLALLRGDVGAARDLLAPATNTDTVYVNAFLHPDRWENNLAAALYTQLTETPPEPDSDTLPLTALTDADSLFVSDLEVQRHHDDENALAVTATFGDSSLAFPVNAWRVLVTSPDAATVYADATFPAEIPDLALVRRTLRVDVPDVLPELMPALVIVEPRHSDAVTYGSAITTVTLNPPGAVRVPDDAEAVEVAFGERIELVAYAASVSDDALDVTFYWQADAQPVDDYQIFLQVLDTNSEVVAQRDSAPLDARYPTGDWRTETVIEDAHRVALDDLPPGDYTVIAGMYTLPDGTRLPLTNTCDCIPTTPDAVEVLRFTR